MEHINGVDIENYLSDHEEKIDDVFTQTIDGFCYLEEINILHRDIRPYNILVDKSGLVKIIDFGFGKTIEYDNDYDKSISLNLWCDPPNEFADKIYNFQTEIYFVGKLFDKIIHRGGRGKLDHKLRWTYKSRRRLEHVQEEKAFQRRVQGPCCA